MDLCHSRENDWHRSYDAQLRQSEVTLKEKEHWFLTLANEAPIGIIETNASGDCLYVNPHWCQLAGLPLEQSLGRGWLQAIHFQDRAQIQRQWFAGAVDNASDGRQAVTLALKEHPDVVLMDVTMPVLNRIEATRRINASLPDTRIIGLSMHEKDDMGAAMQHAGATLNLSKTCSADALINAIRGPRVEAEYGD